MTTPRHIAIIMDGNGRWAETRGLPRILGHRSGAVAVRNVTESCCDLGVSALTLYAFSWENWSRPSDEIDQLMILLDEFLASELPTLHRQHVRLRAIGRLELLPDFVQKRLADVIRQTASYDRLTLTLALSYGGRQEIVDATRRLIQEVQAGRLTSDCITENIFAQHLYQPDVPDPDLLIRTSGEQRLSNFLLWQLSYTELYVTPTYWPDFCKADLVEAITAFEKRERRFGRASDGPEPEPSKTNGHHPAGPV